MHRQSEMSPRARKSILRNCFILFALISVLVGSAAPSIAKKRTTRTDVVNYEAPAAGGHQFAGSVCYGGLNAGCVEIVLQPGDKFVSIDIHDDLGEDVAGRLRQILNVGQGPPVNFCSSTEEPIKVHPRAQSLYVWVFEGACQDNTPSVVTQGTITATLSNLP